MLALALAVLVFSLILAAIGVYGYRIYAKPGQIYDQLAEKKKDSGQTANPGLPRVVQFVESVGNQVPFDPERASQVRRQLLICGYRSNRAVFVIAGLRILLLAASLVGVVLAPVHGLMLWITLAAGALVAYRLPESALKILGKMRQEKLRLSLPDALDLIVICAEAGLGLDQAIRTVTRELDITHPELSEEFRLMALEMAAGNSRAQALNGLAARTGEPELRKFVSVLIQADRFGTSLSDALRVHAEYLRTRRKQAAEARAGKVSVKLVFPIFFLILPSLLLISAGPAVIAIARTLLPLLKVMGT